MGSLNTISFIGNRHANLRDTSGFETPPSKRVGGNFVQDAITGALRHRRLGNRAARNVDKLSALKNQTGASVHACDVTDAKQVEQLFASLDAPDLVTRKT